MRVFFGRGQVTTRRRREEDRPAQMATRTGVAAQFRAAPEARLSPYTAFVVSLYAGKPSTPVNGNSVNREPLGLAIDPVGVLPTLIRAPGEAENACAACEG